MNEIQSLAESNNNDSLEKYNNWYKRALSELNESKIYVLNNINENDEYKIIENLFDDNELTGIVYLDTNDSIERLSYISLITGECLSVVEYLVAIKLVESSLDAYSYISGLTGIDLVDSKGIIKQIAPKSLITDDPPTVNNLPEIQTNNRQLIDVISDSWNAIHILNKQEPQVFSKANILVKICLTDTVPRIEAIGKVNMMGTLLRGATWYKIMGRGGVVADKPPKEIVDDLIEVDHPLKNNLPELEMITTAPIFARDKTIAQKLGYNANAKVYYHKLNDIPLIEDIPQKPSTADLLSAIDFLRNELLVDFPFVNIADIAHTFAALFLPFVRQLIDGPTPFHIVEAPSPGSGKTKLCNLISIIASGEPCKAQAIPGSDDDIRKTITAELMEAKPIILLDNASEKKKLDSPSLAAMITSEVWSDRYLGVTRMVYPRNNALWFLTVNNPQVSMEIARRCIRIRLDTKTDQPWRRTDFKHEYIEEWAKENRGKLIYSILLIIQHWISKNCPLGSARLGSFEKWSAVIGGILNSCNIKGFLDNLEEMYEMSDNEGGAWRIFVVKWWVEFQDKVMSVKDLLDFCDKNNFMDCVIGEGSSKNRLTRFTDALKIARNRTIGEHRIEMVSGGYKLCSNNEEYNPGSELNGNSELNSHKLKTKELMENVFEYVDQCH